MRTVRYAGRYLDRLDADARLSAKTRFDYRHSHQTDVFVVGSDGAVHVVWVHEAGTWNGPLAISPSGLAPAGADLSASNQFGIDYQTDVFLVDHSGTSKVIWVDGAGPWHPPLAI